MKYRVQELEETFDYLIDMEFAILDDIETTALCICPAKPYFSSFGKFEPAIIESPQK